MSQAVIQAQALTVAFPAPGKKVTVAIRDVSLSVAKGEIVCLLGPSGCGKSTLLNIAAGLLKPTRGEIRYAGQRLDGVNTRVGYITQADNLLPWRTVAANVAIGLEVRGLPRSQRNEHIQNVLQLVGMNGHEHLFPSQLSGGMRSRVSLARTLVLEPDTLLMDEPFAALDAQRRVHLQRELMDIHRKLGITIVFVTHDLDEAITLADRIVMFSPGPESRIRNVYTVGYSRPRDITAIRADTEYSQLWQRLWQDLSPTSVTTEDG